MAEGGPAGRGAPRPLPELAAATSIVPGDVRQPASSLLFNSGQGGRLTAEDLTFVTNHGVTTSRVL